MREEITNKKKLDNKGFSLIELIIVIAIMAILIGIVGTQVVPYIEKSKQAKDEQVISSILTNATTAFASNAETYDVADTQTFNIGDSTNTTKVYQEFVTLSGFTSLSDFTNKMSSKAGKSITAVTITRAANTGVITVHVTAGTGYTNVFSDLSST